MSANRSTADWELDDLRWRDEARTQRERSRRTDEADGFFRQDEPDDKEDAIMTARELPPRLTGPRILPDKEALPQVRIEINCICGRVLEAATYLDHGMIKLVVVPCRCSERRAA
jgi:hypothetical protein